MARILVLGNVNCDRVVRLSGPLLRGGRVRGTDTGDRLGGGGANTGVALAMAGHAVRLAAVLGTDAAGDRMLAAVAAHGIDTTEVRRLSGASATLLILVDAEGERTIVGLGGHTAAEHPLEGMVTAPADAIYANTAGARAAQLLQARLCDTLVVSQLNPRPDGWLPGHVVVTSRDHLPEGWAGDPYHCAREALGPGLGWLVVTEGAAGARAFGAGAMVRVPATPARVVDATGAGDVFAAGMIHGLLAGTLPARTPLAGEVTPEVMQEALAVGAAWAALAVASDSSVPPAGLAALAAG